MAARLALPLFGNLARVDHVVLDMRDDPDAALRQGMRQIDRLTKIAKEEAMATRIALPGMLLLAASCAHAAGPLNGVLDRLQGAGFSGTVISGDARALRFERSTGLARRMPDRANGPATVWPWASVTKQVTAMLVMQEVERGRIDLDQPLVRYLPDFKGPSGAQLTVRHLLRHTSGLPNPDATAPLFGLPSFYVETGSRISHRARSAGLCAAGPTAAPGQGFAYNNCDYLLLGALLEKLNGKPYAAIVAERIARPARLAGLAVAADRVSTSATGVVGYDRGVPAGPANLATLGAGGALVGTARDLFALDQLILRGKLLSPASMQVLWRGDPALGYAALGVWSFPATLAGCTGPVNLIERRGQFNGIQVRNLLAPDLGKALLVFVNEASFSFGEIWQGNGASYELASAAFCEQ